jgi:hypothetical protein
MFQIETAQYIVVYNEMLQMISKLETKDVTSEHSVAFINDFLLYFNFIFIPFV